MFANVYARLLTKSEYIRTEKQISISHKISEHMNYSGS